MHASVAVGVVSAYNAFFFFFDSLQMKFPYLRTKKVLSQQQDDEFSELVVVVHLGELCCSVNTNTAVYTLIDKVETCKQAALFSGEMLLYEAENSEGCTRGGGPHALSMRLSVGFIDVQNMHQYEHTHAHTHTSCFAPSLISQ